MILYHFTSFAALKRRNPKLFDGVQAGDRFRWTDDLQPGPDSWQHWREVIIGVEKLPPVIWLTSDPNPKNALSMLPTADLRFTLAGKPPQTTAAIGRLSHQGYEPRAGAENVRRSWHFAIRARGEAMVALPRHHTLRPHPGTGRDLKRPPPREHATKKPRRSGASLERRAPTPWECGAGTPSQSDLGNGLATRCKQVPCRR
jgi:hypothetical protein